MSHDEAPELYRSRMCGRCGHHSDWHRHDEAAPEGVFRCLGGSHFGGCSYGCPDYVDPVVPNETSARPSGPAAAQPERNAPR